MTILFFAPNFLKNEAELRLIALLSMTSSCNKEAKWIISISAIVLYFKSRSIGRELPRKSLCFAADCCLSAAASLIDLCSAMNLRSAVDFCAMVDFCSVTDRQFKK